MPHEDYVGRTETRHDRLDARLLRGLAATLGRAVPDALPPLWHWMLFQDWVMPDASAPMATRSAAVSCRRCTTCRAGCGPAAA